MLMPLLVRLTDSEIDAFGGVIAQPSNGVEHGRGVLEGIGATGLPIYQKATSRSPRSSTTFSIRHRSSALR